jgi:hypothetical protein
MTSRVDRGNSSHTLEVACSTGVSVHHLPCGDYTPLGVPLALRIRKSSTGSRLILARKNGKSLPGPFWCPQPGRHLPRCLFSQEANSKPHISNYATEKTMVIHISAIGLVQSQLNCAESIFSVSLAFLPTVLKCGK